MRYFPSLFAAIFLGGALLSGCAPAAAGYAAGQAASPDEDVQVYLASHDVDSTTARALIDSRILEGMTPKQVHLVMRDKSSYAGPEVTQSDSLLQWVYTPSDPKWVGQYQFTFVDSALVRYSEP